MDDEKYQEFLDEIRPILNKYDLKNVTLCGEHGDRFVGSLGIEKEDKNFSEFMQCVHNTARLYQYARERTFSMLDHVARKR